MKSLKIILVRGFNPALLYKICGLTFLIYLLILTVNTTVLIDFIQPLNYNYPNMGGN